MEFLPFFFIVFVDQCSFILDIHILSMLWLSIDKNIIASTSKSLANAD